MDRRHPNHTWLNAAAQHDDPASIHHHYRRLIELRHTLPVVAHGDFTMLVADHPTVYAYQRHHEDTTLLVVANLAGEANDIELNVKAYDLLLSNTPGDASPVDDRFMLQPWESRVCVTSSPR